MQGFVHTAIEPRTLVFFEQFVQKTICLAHR